MSKDLGTYHVRVELKGIPGFIYEWTTGARYVLGGYDGRCPPGGDITPLSARRQPPRWESEEELLGTIEHIFTVGEYACDCKKFQLWRQANAHYELIETPCGNTYTLARLTVICPNGEEKVLL